MPHLVLLTLPSLSMLDKTQTRALSISRSLVKSLINKSCYNSRTSNDIDMKLGPVIKLEKRNIAMAKYYNHKDNDVVSAN